MLYSINRSNFAVLLHLLFEILWKQKLKISKFSDSVQFCLTFLLFFQIFYSAPASEYVIFSVINDLIVFSLNL